MSSPPSFFRPHHRPATDHIEAPSPQISSTDFERAVTPGLKSPSLTTTTCTDNDPIHSSLPPRALLPVDRISADLTRPPTNKRSSRPRSDHQEDEDYYPAGPTGDPIGPGRKKIKRKKTPSLPVPSQGHHTVGGEAAPQRHENGQGGAGETNQPTLTDQQPALVQGQRPSPAGNSLIPPDDQLIPPSSHSQSRLQRRKVKNKAKKVMKRSSIDNTPSAPEVSMATQPNSDKRLIEPPQAALIEQPSMNTEPLQASAPTPLDPAPPASIDETPHAITTQQPPQAEPPVEVNPLSALSFKRKNKNTKRTDRPMGTPIKHSKKRSPPVSEPPQKRHKPIEAAVIPPEPPLVTKPVRASPPPAELQVVEPTTSATTRRPEVPTGANSELATPANTKTQKRPVTLPHQATGANKTRVPPVKKIQKPPLKKPVQSAAPSEPVKTGEYNLNDPSQWNELFGSGDKKPVAKPVKPGNLPPRSTGYSGTPNERLAARTKQRAEEKKIFSQQQNEGFDLLRQNLDMMEFEIEYKNHVRAMVERPLGSDYVIHQHSGPSLTGESNGSHQIQNTLQQTKGVVQEPSNVLHGPGGYKRYLPPPTLPLGSSGPLSSNQNQPPGPSYQSNVGPVERRKVLPRPGMFGSSFYIWQPAHIS